MPLLGCQHVAPLEAGELLRGGAEVDKVKVVKDGPLKESLDFIPASSAS